MIEASSWRLRVLIILKVGRNPIAVQEVNPLVGCWFVLPTGIEIAIRNRGLNSLKYCAADGLCRHERLLIWRPCPATIQYLNCRSTVPDSLIHKVNVSNFNFRQTQLDSLWVIFLPPTLVFAQTGTTQRILLFLFVRSNSRIPLEGLFPFFGGPVDIEINHSLHGNGHLWRWPNTLQALYIRKRIVSKTISKGPHDWVKERRGDSRKFVVKFLRIFKQEEIYMKSILKPSSVQNDAVSWCVWKRDAFVRHETHGRVHRRHSPFFKCVPSSDNGIRLINFVCGQEIVKWAVSFRAESY